MSKLQGEILTVPKMSGSVSTPKSLSGNVGAKTINIGGRGDDGATFIPSVSTDGIISWTNDKDLPNPEPVNIKGVKGDKGDRGLQGVQGIQGERGEQGQKGDKGDRGEQGIQGVQGAKGETGAQGQKGADGTPATHRWNGTTLYITSASGTSSANLKGDKGDKGDAGSPGADGNDGQPGKDGADGISPVVAVEDIDGGHRLIITDKNGTMIMDIMDGKDGNDGVHWDNVEGKPFGEIRPDTLYWDGNTEGLLEIASDVGNFYKVSDVVLTEDDFFKTWSYEYDIVRISGDSGVIYNERNDDVLDAMFAELGFGIIADWVFCAPTDNYEIPAFGITLPEAGVYFNANYNIRSFHIADFTRFPSTKLMDTKYLPMDDITAAVIAALPVYDGEVVTE